MDISMLSLNEYHQLAKKMVVSPNKSIVSSTLRLFNSNPQAAITQLLQLSSDELATISRDANGSKYLQENFSKNHDLRAKIFSTFLDSGLFISLAKDNFANFVIQKMISEPMPDAYTITLFDAIETHSIDLSFNRYACRVIQKFVLFAPAERVRRLLNIYSGIEGKISKDQNANHVIQRIFENHSPIIFTSFVKALVLNSGVKDIIEDKYGCRVIQVCLERLVYYCSKIDHSSEKKFAYELLHILIQPILRDAIPFSENQYANYIVQYVIRTDFMSVQRKYIIKNSILHNILWLSQSKFASHVVEQALVYADSQCLYAMFSEILDGYETDARGRDAMDIMLFDQYANYVVQRLLTIAIDVANGNREGDKTWIDRITCRVLANSKNLQRYSSGKKILDMLAMTQLKQRYALPTSTTRITNDYLYYS